MSSNAFLISSSLYASLYAVTLTMIIVKRSAIYIFRRCPILLCVSLLGGLVQNIVAFHQIFFSPSDIEEYYSDPKFIFKTRQVFSLLGHFLLLNPYILRGYRLYLIFYIGKSNEYDNNFEKYAKRTYQRFLLKILLVSLIPWLIMTIIIYTSKIGIYLPGSEIEESYVQTNISQCLYIFLSFLEQVSILITIYALRHVIDDYSMVKELAWVSLLWLVMPIFPFLNSYVYIPLVIRNSFLWMISGCFAIIMSVRSSSFIEILTLEMVNNFELLMQSELGLEYFHLFLKRKMVDYEEIRKSELSGLDYLNIFMQTEAHSIDKSIASELK